MTEEKYANKRQYTVVLGWYSHPDTVPGVVLFFTDFKEQIDNIVITMRQIATRVGGDWEIIVFDHKDSRDELPDFYRIASNIISHALYEAEIVEAHNAE